MTDAEGSAADRLEKALRDHEERQKRPALTPGQVRTQVILKQVAKLPPLQRLQVLKDAGLERYARFVGLRPPKPLPPLPDTPVRSGMRASTAYERVGLNKAIDWDYWAMIPELPLWMAVALSLEKNPGVMSGNHHSQYVQMPDYVRRVFGDECANRLDIAIANLGASGALVPVRLYQGASRDPRVIVTMQGFWQFVQNMPRPWPLPGGFPGDLARPTGSHGTVLVKADAAQVESPLERQKRRLADFRQRGGSMRPAGPGWQQNGERGALAALVQKEAEDGRPMSDKKDVRDDLIRAIEAERSRTGE